MKIYQQRLKTTIVHKLLVFREGLKLCVPIWQLIIHDLSKFNPVEFVPYSRYFHGDYPTEYDRNTPGYTGNSKYVWADIREMFEAACEHHYENNPHHWQHWVFGDEAIPMPDKYRREMLADWIVTGIQRKEMDTSGWYKSQRDKMNLHQETRDWLDVNTMMYEGTGVGTNAKR